MSGGEHMTPDEFRRVGTELVEWVATYMEEVERYPVLSRAAPGGVRAALPSSPPETGESWDRIIADLDRVILPGITHWQSPNFFAYFNSNASGPSVLGELVAAGLGVQGMLWSTSPSATELETHVLDWLAELLGLPDRFRSGSGGGGMIQDSASSSVLTATIAARERATGNTTNQTGIDRTLVAYASSQAHSSVEKAMSAAGIGSANLRLLPVDDRFALKPADLAAIVAADEDAGLTPFLVTATVGTTSSHAMDPLRPIGEICRRHGLWLHVDAAHAGTAAVCPEFRAMHDGLELADSYNVNPHKWMFTTMDCSALFVADRSTLIRAFSVLPEYLKNRATESGTVIDYRDWAVPLGRRFRALKLWFVIRHYGVEGLRRHVREHVRLARHFTALVEQDPDLEIAVPPPLNLVCFRHRGGDEVNRRIMHTVNDSGALFLTHTVLAGALTLRMSIGQTHTEQRHIDAAWEAIRTAARSATG